MRQPAHPSLKFEGVGIGKRVVRGRVQFPDFGGGVVFFVDDIHRVDDEGFLEDAAVTVVALHADGVGWLGFVVDVRVDQQPVAADGEFAVIGIACARHQRIGVRVGGVRVGGGENADFRAAEPVFVHAVAVRPVQLNVGGGLVGAEGHFYLVQFYFLRAVRVQESAPGELAAVCVQRGDVGVDVRRGGGFRAAAVCGRNPVGAVPVLPRQPVICGNLIGHRAFVVLAQHFVEGKQRRGKRDGLFGGDVGLAAGIAFQRQPCAAAAVPHGIDFRRGEQAVDEKGFVQIAVEVAKGVMHADAIGVVICAEVEIADVRTEVKVASARNGGRLDQRVIEVEAQVAIAVYVDNREMPVAIVVVGSRRGDNEIGAQIEQHPDRAVVKQEGVAPVGGAVNAARYHGHIVAAVG